jgi:hypothetical protein
VEEKREKVKRVDGPFHLRDFADECPGRPMLHVFADSLCVESFAAVPWLQEKPFAHFLLFWFRVHAPDPVLARGYMAAAHITMLS